MSISLMQICKNAESKYNMKLVAGRDGMENMVRWVHMVEDSEVPDFLHGNELVFTTGIGHSGNEWLVSFAISLKEHGAAGLVVNIGPYISAVPPQVIVYCEQNSFPLFTLPWEVKIIDITFDFCRRIIDSDEQEVTLAESFRNLIFSSDNKTGYAEQLNRMGFRDTSDYIIIAIAVSGKDSVAEQILHGGKSPLIHMLRQTRNPFAIFYQDDKLISVRQNMTHDEMRRLQTALSRMEFPAEVHIGISESGYGYDKIPQCYKQAITALSVSEIQGERMMSYNDTGVYKLLFNIDNRDVLRDYVDGILGTVIRYDSANGTDYEKTLYNYFMCGGSVQRTADLMRVHRNTINYKIKAIRELTGMELNDEDRMNILLALHAREVLKKY